MLMAYKKWDAIPYTSPQMSCNMGMVPPSFGTHCSGQKNSHVGLYTPSHNISLPLRHSICRKNHLSDDTEMLLVGSTFLFLRVEILVPQVTVYRKSSFTTCVYYSLTVVSRTILIVSECRFCSFVCVCI